MRVAPSNINAFLFAPNKQFRIPDFQRPYSWEPPNIHAFLNDLEEARRSGRSHYFGNIVYITSSGMESTIIDGQQRATTTLLMITAIYHLILKDESKSALPAEQINKSFLYNEFSKEKNRIKLRTVTVDDEIFTKIYLSATNTSSLTAKDKTSRLYNAYMMFYDYFSDKDRLDEYVEALQKFEIVDLSLEPTDDNPQKVFESINSTGIPLSDGDKIRNFALMLNDEEMRRMVYTNYWQSIERSLTDINTEFITDFFRYYLISRLQKDVNMNQVYPRFKELFAEAIGEDQSNEERIRKFYDYILIYLDNYVFLKFNRDPDGKFDFIANNAFRLGYTQIETTFPFLLSVLYKYETGKLKPNEVKEIFETIEAYLVRRIICNIPTAGLNKLFASLDRDIKNYSAEYESASYVDIFKFILLDRSQALRLPDDKEVNESIRTNKFYYQKKIYVNFVLSSVEDKAQSNEAFYLKQIAAHTSKLSIEHVMPQTLNKAWMQELGENALEIHTQYLHTLPNLTLTGYNPKYSNRSFDEKKTIENGFNESPLALNQYIKDCKKWDLETLKDRTTWWEKRVHEMWPVPTSKFKPSSSHKQISFTDDVELKGSMIRKLIVFGEEVNVASWAEALDLTVEAIFRRFPDFEETIADDEFLARHIRKDSETLLEAQDIEGTDYFVETGTNTTRKKKLFERLGEKLELQREDIMFELSK